MKRKGHLIEQIAERENLELAYYKAQLGKQNKSEVFIYGKHLKENLKSLQKAILSGDIGVGQYHYFKIFDPKERLICAASFPERVLHHAIMNVCDPHFEKKQITHSYASRRHKGTYSAIKQAQVFSRKYAWFLKLDVRKYFDSICHLTLMDQLSRMYKDKGLLSIFQKIINSYETSEGRGLPIGNLTSQYFANHYLSSADHFAKEFLKSPAYVRYMDDMVLWHQDKSRLIDMGHQFCHEIAFGLHLTTKPFCLNDTNKGLPFLGYIIYPDNIRLSQNSRRRYRKKINQYSIKLNSGIWSQAEFHARALPLTSFTLHASALSFRQKTHQELSII